MRCWRLVPWLAQVFPRWISGFDERYLFGAGPAFQFFLSLDRFAHFGESFKPDEALAVISGGESAVFFLLVLEGALDQVTGDAYVQSAASAGHHVGEIEPLTHGANVRRGRRMRCAEGHSKREVRVRIGAV